jgi:hypothetical protein
MHAAERGRGREQRKVARNKGENPLPPLELERAAAAARDLERGLAGRKTTKDNRPAAG